MKEREKVYLQQRLEALADYAILDSGPEPGFDDIAVLARTLCQTPVALVSLVERDRQWFKARAGLDVKQTPISHSVCQHGMASPDLLVIPDLTADERTSANPLVTDDPHMRFYAGAPLVTPGGAIIGMLCVIDYAVRPEGLTDEQRLGLAALSRQVIAQLELRKAMALREQALTVERRESAFARRIAARLEIAEEAAEIGAFEVDLKTQNFVTSREFCRIHGIPLMAEISVAELAQRVPQSQDVGRLAINGPDQIRCEVLIQRENDGAMRWMEVRGRFLRDDSGRRVTMAGVVSDVTDRRTVNEEVLHRMKNTLALVQSIAQLTLRHHTDEEKLGEFMRRTAALADAHDALLRPDNSVAGLHEIAIRAFSSLSVTDRVSVSGPDLALAPRAVMTSSMLLHELTTNSLKYGALSCEDGEVFVTTSIDPRPDGDWLLLEWHDVGGPAVRTPKRTGLGSRLIKAGLAPGGTAELDFAPEGLRATFAAPITRIS